MKINTKVELGIVALTDIAIHSEDGQTVLTLTADDGLISWIKSN